MSRLNHKIVSTEIARLLSTQPDTRYNDVVDLCVLHLICHPSTIRNSMTKMRIDELVIGEGARNRITYRLTRKGEKHFNVPESSGTCAADHIHQLVTKAEVKATICRPRFKTGIEQFVYESRL